MKASLIFSSITISYQRPRVKYLLAISLFSLNIFWCDGQATFTFDQITKSISTKDSKWKVGQNIKVVIKNYGCTERNYVITYKGDERVNEDGLAMFREAAGAVKTDREGLTSVCDDLPYLMIPIVNKDYSMITVEEFDGDKSVDKQTYTFRNRGGLKFDVSTGFFVSGLKDDTYIIKSDGSTSSGVITKEQSGDMRVGLGVLAHVHSRWPCIFNLGAAGGFELDNDAKVGYLAGGSILLGYDQKFVFSGGVVFGKKAKISNAYYEGQLVDFNLSVIPTVQVWEMSWFGSLTYNF